MKLKKLNEKKNGITFPVFKNKERFWLSGANLAEAQTGFDVATVYFISILLSITL